MWPLRIILAGGWTDAGVTLQITASNRVAIVEEYFEGRPFSQRQAKILNVKS